MTRNALLFAIAAAALSTGPATAPAHACTGSSADPTHCINNSQAIDGFSDFFSSNLEGLPEVTSVSPGRNSSGVNPGTSFVLTFSEPMDTATVEDNFIIRSFTEELLTVDDTDTFNDDDNEPFSGNPEDGNVWDDSAFDVDWNSDDTEVTLTFTNERQLPTDRDSENTPDYFVSLNNEDDTQIPDSSGITRDENYFKLTDGNFENIYKFSVQTDEDRPDVDSISSTTSGSGDDDRTRFVESQFQIEVPGNRLMVFYGRLPGEGGDDPAPSSDAPGLDADPDDERALFETTDSRFQSICYGPRCAPVSGETVRETQALVDGQSVDIEIIRTENGEHFAVDPEDGHNYGPIHESRSGFGWSFDGTPRPKPEPDDVSHRTVLLRAVSEADAGTLFADGFESGNTSAWQTQADR